MKVCDIKREGTVIYVDNTSCSTADQAYKKFRELYNQALGKANYSKLGHAGQRRTRITETGIALTKEYADYLRLTYPGKTVKWYLLGLVETTYCKIVGRNDFAEEYDTYTGVQAREYIYWIFSKGSGVLRQYGRRDHLGRTNFNYKYNGRKKQNRIQGTAECKTAVHR